MLDFWKRPGPPEHNMFGGMFRGRRARRLHACESGRREICLRIASPAGLAVRTITAPGAPANDLEKQFAKANKKSVAPHQPALAKRKCVRRLASARQSAGDKGITRYHRRPQPPLHLFPHPPPPRRSRTTKSSNIAPMVALTIALIAPVPRSMPS